MFLSINIHSHYIELCKKTKNKYNLKKFGPMLISDCIIINNMNNKVSVSHGVHWCPAAIVRGTELMRNILIQRNKKIYIY